MARTSKKAIDKTAKSMSTTDSPTNQIVKPVSLSTIDAFKDCLSIQPNQSFYDKIPDIYFIRPTKQMNTLLQLSGQYAVKNVSKLVTIDLEKYEVPESDSDVESCDVESETSSVPRHYFDDHVICIPSVRTKTRGHPLLEEVKEFVDVLLRCPPFINHLIVVKDHHNYEFCWCPMCSVLIEWTKQQCSTSFNSRITKCKLKGRVRYNDLLNHLSSNATCYFHQAAFFY